MLTPTDDYRARTSALLEAEDAAPRIWAHRVNSLGALDEAKALFAGIEVDLMFEPATRSFSVRHPPATHTGLTLDVFLARAADRPELRLWLDWKNPSADNLADALTELERLDAKYRIRGRALVETPSEATFPAIATISDRRFLHGFYLPTDRTLTAMRDPRASAALAGEIRTALKHGRFDALTYDARLQPFIDAQLDGWLQARGIRRFSWDQRINRAGGSTARLSPSIEARKLDALLINFPSRFRV